MWSDSFLCYCYIVIWSETKTAERKSVERLVEGCDIMSTSLFKIIHDWKQQNLTVVIMRVTCCICFLSLSTLDRVWICGWLKKKYPLAWIHHPPQNSIALCVRVLRSALHCLCHYFLGINFLKQEERNKKHMLCIVYSFLGFLGYCQTCIMRATALQSSPLITN